jgi:hypothetical protein
MTADELNTLLREIRRGRTEGDSLEWKRQWWDLRSPGGKAEFRRDVASLANSARGSGILIVGLKEGRLYEAPLPCDEAELQQLIRAVVPTPNVSIEALALEGTTVSVLTVSPPFDRPYVMQWNDLNAVFLRHGSSIASATRFELDAFYQQQERRPSLTVEWQFWPPGTLPNNQHSSSGSARSNILEVPGPNLRIDAVVDMYQARFNSLKESHRSEGYPDAGQLGSYEAKLNAFLVSLSDRKNLVYWYVERYSHSRAVPFTVVFDNNGTSPATEVKLRVNYPEWLFVFDELPKSGPKSYIKPPATPPRPRPPRSAVDEMMEAMRPRVPNFSALPMPFIPPIRQTSGNYLDGSNRRATFWADRVLHAHRLVTADKLRAIALPDAPQVTDPIPLQAEIFSSEMERWETGELRVRLGEVSEHP